LSEPHGTSIINLTYNKWQDTLACLTSVFESNLKGAHVIVVDNGSEDETLTLLPQRFPRVELIRNTTNLGYADGNNVGLKLALDRNSEFVTILNNDVRVAPDWLVHLRGAAGSDMRAALVGPLVMHADEPERIQSAGGILPSNWHAFHRGANELDQGQYAAVESVDWLSGCTVLARCSALYKIGFLDASFYMYGEDVDWCVRARRADFSVLFAPRARVWHSGVSRDYTPAPYVTYYSARNELNLIRKHRGGVPLVQALARQTRTLTSWTVRPRWREQREHRDALAHALRDFVRGVSGQSIER
jgi:GT2 family glycosyltransferase